MLNEFIQPLFERARFGVGNEGVGGHGLFIKQADVRLLQTGCGAG